MDSSLIKAFRAAQKSRERARRRDRELREFFFGGFMVFAGFLLAVLYILLTHQIST